MFHGSDFLFSHHIFYTGYDVEGPVMNYCQANGTWLYKESTHCTLQSCPPPEGIHNGYWISSHSRDTVRYNNETQTLFNSSVLETSLYVGTVLSPVCIEGYTPSIPLYSITCLPTLLWNISTPLIACDPIQCPLPTTDNHTSVHSPSNSTRYGSEIVYTCRYGYRLIGDRYRTCLSNTTWSGTESYCLLITCSDMQPENNKLIISSGGKKLGDVVKFSCVEGYKLVGEQDIFCTDNSSWSAITPDCVEVVCDTPPNVPNGILNYTSTSYSSNVTYTCKLG